MLNVCVCVFFQDVVFIIRKNGSVEGRATLEAGPQAQAAPITVLVDKGTASAAEVFAAAVRYAEALTGCKTFFAVVKKNTHLIARTRKKTRCILLI